MDTDTAKTPVAEVVDSARERTQEQASHAVEKGRGALRTQVDTRSTQAGGHAQSIAETLRQTATQLRQTGDDQKTRYAGIADQSADRLERVGGYLTESDAEELLSNVEEVARTAAVAGGRDGTHPGDRHRPVLEGLKHRALLPAAAAGV